MTSEHDDDVSQVLRSAPEPLEQRAIIEALEEDGVEGEEEHHTYCISKSWFQTWQKYVGLSPNDVISQRASRSDHGHSKSDNKCWCRKNTDHGRNSETSRKCKNFSSHSSQKQCSVGASAIEDTATRPPEVEMDVTNYENNLYVNEKIWLCFVRWFGVANTHELDRRHWASDEKDFEICILSPYCGLIENPIKTFDIAEECGYVETQLRRIFRIAESRSTRLWMCEKARHARFRPLLNRQQELGFQDSVVQGKSYIIALEVANLDGTWPTYIPGEPVGFLDVYRDLTESGHVKNSVFWDNELKETLETVFAGVSNELRETASGIVSTTKCIVSLKENDLEKLKVELQSKVNHLKDKQRTLENRISDLQKQELRLSAEREKLKTDEESFTDERQRFAEELVRMHTINKIQETRVKLNVGGHVFVTSTLTLTKDGDSMLAAMFSGRHSLKQEEDGSYFLDRDGTHFRYILNYLRDGTFRPGTLPSSEGFLAELLTETEYYQLTGLKKLIEMMMDSGADLTNLRLEESPAASASDSSIGQSVNNNVKTSPTKRIQRKVISHVKLEK